MLNIRKERAERAVGAVWVACMVVPLVCVALSGTITTFLVASIFLLGTTVQAFKTAPLNRTSTLEGSNYDAARARGRFKHMLVIFSVSTLLLLTLGSHFAGGIHLLFHGSFYVNTKNSH
jgi:hypothetical protein